MLMGRHAIWRKQLKKLRRKLTRQKLAAERDDILKKEQERQEKSPRYQQWLIEQESIKLFEEQEVQRIAQEEQKKWLEREKESQREWEKLQKRLAHIKEERRKQEERIQQEWEKEQNLIKEAKEQKEKEREERERQEELFRQQIDDYVANGGCIPQELLGNLETNPGKEICPFFSKVGVCRFGDACSRNHVRPRVSNILLFRGFYSHITLDQTLESEYGNDSSLEYDDRDTHIHFCEFFDDVLPELQKCGCVVQFRVCCNKEPHLRGNVYVEYMSPRDAIRAFRTFQGRWYGGKQLNVEFSNISSWRSAICGLNFRRRCPKGSACNFLHVFKNPGRMFEDYSTPREERYSEPKESSRNWRWSVTPEREENHQNNGHRKQQRSPYEHRSSKYKHRKHTASRRSSSRSRSRSKSKSRSPTHHRKAKQSRERSKDKLRTPRVRKRRSTSKT